MKRFFKKIFAFISTLFTNLNNWIYDHVQPSIETLQRLKEVVDNPVIDALTAVIPTQFDDKVKDWIRENLNKAIDVLGVVADIEAQPTWDLKLAKLIEYLRTLTPAMRSAVYHKLASEMAKASGGRDNVKGHSVDLLTQIQYSKLVEGVEAKDLPENVCESCKQSAGKQKHYDPVTMTWI